MQNVIKSGFYIKYIMILNKIKNHKKELKNSFKKNLKKIKTLQIRNLTFCKMVQF